MPSPQPNDRPARAQQAALHARVDLCFAPAGRKGSVVAAGDRRQPTERHFLRTDERALSNQPVRDRQCFQRPGGLHEVEPLLRFVTADAAGLKTAERRGHPRAAVRLQPHQARGQVGTEQRQRAQVCRPSVGLGQMKFGHVGKLELRRLAVGQHLHAGSSPANRAEGDFTSVGQHERARLRAAAVRLPDDPPHEVESHADLVAVLARQVDFDAWLDQQPGKRAIAGRAFGVADDTARQAVSADEFDPRGRWRRLGDACIAEPADRILGIE